MNKLYTISLLPAIFFSNYTTAIELSKYLSTSIEPTPKVRVTPRYPADAARSSREGWAKFSFIIEKDGSVSNVITQETSGSKDLTLAAKKALIKWQYEPAIENGHPVQQCVNNVQFSFNMRKNGTSGATKRFKDLYIKTQEALKEKNYSKTQALLARFKKIKYLHLSENNYLQLLHAQYASEIGDPALQLSHLYSVKIPAGEKNNQQRLSVLKQRFLLEVKLNRLKYAYSTFKSIEKIPQSQTELQSYKDIIKRIDNFIVSDKELIVNANIKKNDYWHHALVRNEFSLTNINGKLSKMDIRCANKRHVYSIENNNTWKIPNSWQQCKLFIFGENDTSFNIVEYPFNT
ncbi:energy transducer TonB [Cognaticolwellia mytili]|uniref:energy transducer TonB n=1 Tax=Cognaticolwellia mytili TaxID=1888913 RepID=UPI000A172D97|nr:energy transducer TonB [Cognaticolwellia mytili]